MSAPRFFVPESSPRPLTESTPLYLVDAFLHRGTRYAVTLDAYGSLWPWPDAERDRLPPRMRRELNAHELSGPLRSLDTDRLWLFALHRLSPPGPTPGLNDPVEAFGTLCGPFPSSTPLAVEGHVATTRGDLLEGIVRGAWTPFLFGEGAGERRIDSLLIAGGDEAETAAGTGVIVAWPLSTKAAAHGDVANSAILRSMLHELLTAIRADQIEEGCAGALAARELPVPSRAELVASLEARGFKIDGAVARRARKGLLGGLFPERILLPPTGSLEDYLALARIALAELPGWPTPRALRRALELSEASWRPHRPLALRPNEQADLDVTASAVVSIPPEIRPTEPGDEAKLKASWRALYFAVDPASLAPRAGLAAAGGRGPRRAAAGRAELLV
ncbi:MAG: hypothetical protein ACOX6T_15755 [Myxococcales bacterium]|jgi:hypothetical protein